MQIKGFESALRLIRSGSDNTPLSRLLALVQTLADCSASALFVNRDGGQEIVLGRGMPYSFFTSPMPDRPPLADVFETPLEVPDARDHPILGRRAFATMREHWLWLAGVPVELAPLPYRLTLLAMDPRAGRVWDAGLLTTLERLASIAADELSLIGDIAQQHDRDGDLIMDARCVREAVDGSTLPMALIGRDLTVRAVSESMADLMEVKAERQRGRSALDLLDGEADEVLGFFRSRLDTPGGRQTLTVGRSDARPPLTLNALHCTEIGSGDDVIFVTAQPPGAPNRLREEALVPAPLRGERPSVTCEFLLGTLVPNQKLRRRGSTDYHTLVRWRASAKDAQIAALRALKADPPDVLVAPVADRLVEAATSLFGRGTVRAVCAVPCGHSGPDCLSERLGGAVAARLELPFRRPFAPLPSTGSSHPAKNARRPAMRVVKPVAEPILLIDDVATSGAHIAEAACLLRRIAPAVLPIAWIGG